MINPQGYYSFFVTGYLAHRWHLFINTFIPLQISRLRDVLVHGNLNFSFNLKSDFFFFLMQEFCIFDQNFMIFFTQSRVLKFWLWTVFEFLEKKKYIPIKEK